VIEMDRASRLREEMIRKVYEKQHDRFDTNFQDDLYSRLEYVRQFTESRGDNPMQQAYPELLEFVKSMAEAFRGEPISDRELSAIIAASIFSWEDPRHMATVIEYRCTICPKECRYRFTITHEVIRSAAINVMEMHKREMLRQMGYEYSKKCEYALK